jgi:tol-pal system protein YbgF
MKNTCTFNKGLFLVGILCLLVVSCSSNQVEPEAIPDSTDGSSAIYQDITSKYKQLFKQNVELRQRIINLEEAKEADQNKNLTEINNLLSTIQLLELNIKQMNSRLSSNTQLLDKLAIDYKAFGESGAAQSGNPFHTSGEEEAVDLGVEGEFKTPESSKAIRTIPLVPGVGATINNPSLPEAGISQAGKSNKAGKTSLDSVFVTPQKESEWNDPDLKPPTSPIRLKIISGAKKAYQNSFRAYSARDFKGTIRLFSDFLSRFPSDVDADNSQYWIGQTYFQLQDYIKAETAFRQILKNYEHKDTKHGYKTPDSILMLGRIYTIRKKPIKGRYYFQEVINRFPASRSAAKAKREIQSMSVF